jgi:hypothetical protein
LKEFLQFDRMITGSIIKYVYWVLAGLTVISGLIAMLVALFSVDVLGLFSGLLVAVLGPFLIRIYCELLIVMFKIYETLVEIRDR